MLLERLHKSRQLTGIHLDHDEIRMVSLRQGPAGPVLHAAVTIKRAHGALAADLAEFARETKGFTGPTVIISEEVKFLSIDLEAAGSDALSEERLLAAAIWEMEPFLEFTASEGLFQCRLQPGGEARSTVPVLVSAVSRQIYADLAAALKKLGLDLVAAYAPQAALACASDLAAVGKSKLLLDVGAESIRAVLLSDRGPVAFQDAPRGPSSTSCATMIHDMAYGLGLPADADVELVLSGTDLDTDLAESLASFFPLIRIWGTGDAVGANDTAEVVDCNPAYALAAGAVFGQMRRFGQMVPAVTDRVPFSKALIDKLKQNRRAVPAAVLICFIVCLGAHYGFTQWRIARYNSEIRLLETRKARLEAPLVESKRLKETIAGITQKIHFIEHTLPSQNRHILTLFTALAELVPTDVAVDKIEQLDTRTFLLNGNAFRGKAITDFSEALSALESCEAAILVNVRRSEGSETTRSKILPYSFAIRVMFTSKEDS
jgi:Tfp pilus assembly protein PilN